MTRDELKGETIFVIGGGPSLKKQRLELLKDKAVVTANNAYTLFPNAYVAHHADSEWWSWHSPQFFDVFKGKYVTGAGHKNYPSPIIRLRKVHDHELSEAFPLIHGSNAGHQGINIAYLLGASKIVLLGFDMKKEGENTHWHNEHKRETNTSQWERVMLPGFKTLPAYLKKKGVEIYNTNFDSAIQDFEFKHLEDFV